MDVCLVGLEIVPRKNLAFYGGLAQNVVNIAKGLTMKGKYKVTIISSDVNKVLAGAFLTPWAEIIPIETRSRYSSSLFGLEFLIGTTIASVLCRRSFREYDVVHVHSAYPMLASVLKLLSLRKGTKSVFTLYSPLSEFLNSRGRILGYIPQRSLSKVFMSRIGRIVAVSENVRRSLKVAGFDNQIDVVPPAIDTSLFNPDVSGKQKRVELSLGEGPVILYCGNWTPWKGVDILVESMNGVVKQFPESKLVLAFGEPITWHLESRLLIEDKIRSYGLGSHVVETGFLDDFPQLMAACDLFVAPFRDTREVSDIPLAILEAMACGKPVVATRVGGVPEIISHNDRGFLVEPNDCIALSNAIRFALSSKKRMDEVGHEAAEYVLSKHNLETVAGKMQDIYENL